MVTKEARDHIILIKRKLTSLIDINEDIINEIIKDITDLLKFETYDKAVKIFKRNKKPTHSIKPNISPAEVKNIQKLESYDNDCVTVTKGIRWLDIGNDF